MKKIIYTALVAVTVNGLVLTSCSDDFTETRFFQSEQAEPLTSVEQLESFVRGTYAKMRNTYYLGSFYRAYAEVRSDEMYNNLATDRLTTYTDYTIKSSSSEARSTWKALYGAIADANIVINTSENLTWGKSSNSTTIANKVKNLKGQAYAARALATFDLLRLYGQKYSGGTLGVVLPTVYNPNGMAARATIAETEAQIEADFQAALNNIGSTTDTSDKTYISPLAVKALMTRYYLYKGDYARVAALVADIKAGPYKVVASGDLASSFNKENADNSIFELAVGLNGALGVNAYDYLLNTDGYGQIQVLPSAKALYSTGDVRLNLFKDKDENDTEFLLKKFPSVKGIGNIKVIRYEEVLLNGAEAAFQIGDTTTALVYYNLIRQNRGLAAATSLTLSDIKNERVRELIGEGFRYWDLLRWGDAIPYYDSSGVRKSSRNVGDKLLAMPIPDTETNVSGTLVVSNPGYDN